jgi:Cu/Zn superoxide dismutase
MRTHRLVAIMTRTQTLRHTGALRGAVAVVAICGAGLALPTASADSAQVVRATGPTVVHDASVAGIKTRVHAVSTASGSTIVTLHVTGFSAGYVGRHLGAHVHVGACGADPLASGPHYASPDADPDASLEQREIWLDFTVNAAGVAHARASRPWHIGEGDANAVVIHAMHTDPVTGAAGARLACTTVPFGVG